MSDQVVSDQLVSDRGVSDQGVSGQGVQLDSCGTKLVDADRVDDVRARLIDPGEATRLADLFKLLGDPTRARLLHALLEGGELCVCDLAETVAVPESTVSHALRLLRTAGVVRNRRAGRMIYYSLDDSHVRLLLDLSLQHLRHAEAGPSR
jgi:ArsR family transcriptional regulator, lead/cadmium/zinc/bismuth-responsive transcriptional repressor